MVGGQPDVERDHVPFHACAVFVSVGAPNRTTGQSGCPSRRADCRRRRSRRSRDTRAGEVPGSPRGVGESAFTFASTRCTVTSPPNRDRSVDLGGRARRRGLRGVSGRARGHGTARQHGAVCGIGEAGAEPRRSPWRRSTYPAIAPLGPGTMIFTAKACESRGSAQARTTRPRTKQKEGCAED